jgi:dipeptidyl aminopeptidase/acylaminoacyl peptidase
MAMALLALTPALAQPAVTTREQGALVMENVPETPPEVRERLQRYANVRAAHFQDWMADGSMLIATRFGQSDQLHRVIAPGSRRTQLTFFDEPIDTALAQPGAAGRFIVTRDTGGAENYQAYAGGLDGASSSFTEPTTRNEFFAFSRDGKMLAWSRSTPASPDYDIMVMAAGDPSSRRVAFKGKGALAPLAFSPDGVTLLVQHIIAIGVSSKLSLLDLASGKLTEIHPTNAQIAYAGGEFTPDGRTILTLSDEGSDVARLVSYDLATKRFTPLADGGRWEVEKFDLAGDGRTLAYAINEGGRSKVVLRDLASGRTLAQPTTPVGVVEALQFSPDGRSLAIGIDGATQPADVWVWELGPARLTRWTYSEMGGIAPGAPVEPTLAKFSSFDGLEVPAWVYKPRRPGKAPVIIRIHGGPEGQARPTFSPTFQYWTNELGAAVIVPNVRGSTGYGKTYVGLDNGMKRRDSVKDIGALLDWIAKQPDLDSSRVVVTGGSYGGYMTLATLADYNERLAGGIEAIGIANWVTFLTNTVGYRRDLRRVEYGDERQPEMRAFMERDSPVAHVAKIKTPLFVIAGFNDPRVPWTEGQQIVRGARANGVEVWWMMAKDEGHGFLKKQNIDAQNEAETLFLQKLLGVR